MKPCTRFHFENVEPGDRITLVSETRKDMTVTIRRAYTTRRFGDVIQGTDGNTYYLDDYDFVKDAQS